jgi:hypothetical protein
MKNRTELSPKLPFYLRNPNSYEYGLGGLMLYAADEIDALRADVITAAEQRDSAHAAVKILAVRIGELEAALRDADCPRPINGAGVMLEEHTVGLCVKLGYCGCGNAALLAADRKGEHTKENF